MRQILFATLPCLVIGCSGSGSGSDDGDDEAAAGDTGGSPGPEPAALTTPSGDCPDLSSGGSLEIISSGEDRAFELVLPETMPDGDIGLVFFFHGIANVGSDPAGATARSMRVQDLADEYGIAVVLPESPIQSLAGISFHLWDIALESDHDLVLYDDLRSCMADQHPIDLHRVVASGFSGGALFTTVIGANRGDTLAAMVEGSGGADLDVPIWDELGSAWKPSPHLFPSLLITGGRN